jgi:hypothetical protein
VFTTGSKSRSSHPRKGQTKLQVRLTHPQPYADDFDGLFQALPVVPGGHTVGLYLAGYRTATKSIYLPPGSTFRLREQLMPLVPGEVSALPTLAPPLPEPPSGTYTSPRTPPRDQPTPPVMRAEVAAPGFGALSRRVQPTNAVVTVDGDEWPSAKEGELVVHLAVGSHAVTVTLAGRLGFSSEVVIRENETTELNVSVPDIDLCQFLKEWPDAAQRE